MRKRIEVDKKSYDIREEIKWEAVKWLGNLMKKKKGFGGGMDERKKDIRVIYFNPHQDRVREHERSLVVWSWHV